MLDHRFQLIQGFIQLCLPGLQGLHFPIEIGKIPAELRREGGDPFSQQPVFFLLVSGRLVKGRDISGEAFPKIMDQAHSDNPIHIRCGKLIPQKKGHEGNPPAMFRHALRPAPGGDAVTQGVLQPPSRVQDIQKGAFIHSVILPASASTLPPPRLSAPFP